MRRCSTLAESSVKMIISSSFRIFLWTHLKIPLERSGEGHKFRLRAWFADTSPQLPVTSHLLHWEISNCLIKTMSPHYASDTLPDTEVMKDLWVQAVHDLMRKNRCTILKWTLKCSMGCWLQISERQTDRARWARVGGESFQGQIPSCRLLVVCVFALSTGIWAGIWGDNG